MYRERYEILFPVFQYLPLLIRIYRKLLIYHVIFVKGQ